jgi:hypothetical protein
MWRSVTYFGFWNYSALKIRLDRAEIRNGQLLLVAKSVQMSRDEQYLKPDFQITG